MILFISGMLVAGYLVAAAFFLRFWRQSRDRLFAFFGAAFLLLAVQRAVLTLVEESSAPYAWSYVLRLFAFLMILWAIVDKNRPGR